MFQNLCQKPRIWRIFARFPACYKRHLCSRILRRIWTFERDTNCEISSESRLRFGVLGISKIWQYFRIFRKFSFFFGGGGEGGMHPAFGGKTPVG